MPPVVWMRIPKPSLQVPGLTVLPRNQPMVPVVPAELTVPLSVAPVEAIFVAAVVETIGREFGVAVGVAAVTVIVTLPIVVAEPRHSQLEHCVRSVSVAV